MKILLVNKFLYPRGGAETYFLRIGEYLEKQGHEIQYFGMQDPKNTVGNALNLSTRNMDFHSHSLQRFLYPFHIVYSGEAKKKIKQVAKNFKPDVVHFNNINFQLTPSVIDGISELGIPMVQTVHDLQMLCPNHLMLDLNTKTPCEKCLAGSKWPCVSGRCIHGSLPKSLIGSVEGELYRRRPTYRKVDRYICPSRFIESMLLRDKRFQGKTVHIQNFIEKDPGRAADSEYKKVFSKKDYVLYFGRLSEEKGIIRLLDACRLIPDIPFVIAGSGPEERLLKENCPSNVTYVGFKTGEALKKLISEALFSVYLSVWYENCPLSILESQTCGTPVIANRIGGIPELVEDGQTGILIDEFTPENYAGKIQSLYEDRTLLAEMTENCLKKTDYLTLEKYCSRLLGVYEEVIGR